jgi:hypothetical protein
MRALLVICLLALAARADARPGVGIGVLPSEVDVGVSSAGTMEVLAGLHWASLAWKPPAFDVGIGYVGTSRNLPASAALQAMPEAVRLDGGYVAFALALFTRPHVRSWIGARGELLDVHSTGTASVALGGAIRLAAEVYVAGLAEHTEDRTLTLAAGALALGLYVEASHRAVSDELDPDAITTGVSLRIPLAGMLSD